MVHLEHKSSAREEGAKTLLIGAGLTTFCGAIPVLAWYQGEFSPGAVIWSIALGLFALASFLLFCGGLLRIIVGGHWHITVSDEVLAWSPPPLAEHPFRYAPAEVRLEKRVREKPRKDGRIKEKIKYVLIGNDGCEHWINQQSGLDVDAFVAATQQAGVPMTEVRTRRRAR